MHFKEPSIDLLSVLLLIGAAQGLFLSIVLVRIKTGNRIANRFLVALLLVLSANLVEWFMSATYYYLRYPGLIGVQWPLSFASGPLGYFYVRKLTEPQKRSKPWKTALHFLPVVLFYIRLIPFFTLNPVIKSRIWYFQNSDYQNYSSVIDPILYVIIVQIIIYLVLSWRLLTAHEKRIRQTFSSIESITLSWLKTLIVIFCCLLIVWIFFAIFSQFLGIYKQAEYLGGLAGAAAIYVMGYKGIRRPEIFVSHPARDEAGLIAQNQRKPVLDRGVRAKPDDTGRYVKSSLTSEQSQDILSRLLQLMSREKPYLNMELTLPVLSNMLSVYPHHLSQVINENLGKNFFDFVNSYRVEETKKALLSPSSDRLSILGIALDAGFNSKSSFYTAFKKHTGMTPSQFKKRSSPGQSAGQDS